MGKLVLHKNPDNELVAQQRAARYAALSFTKKLDELFALIDAAVKLNGGAPLKKPLGAGVVLQKNRQHGHTK